MTCTHPGCDSREKVRPHGLCVMHRRRLNAGTPMDAPRPQLGKPSRDPLGRWWGFVDASGGPQVCWPWRGGLFPSGHGLFVAGSRTDRSITGHGAHRWGYERLIGSVPAGLELDHTCHSRDLTCAGGATCPHRACVNPTHLEPVTHMENSRRGRATKLTEQQVQEIRLRYDGTRGALRRLAPDYGVHPDTIGLVVRRHRIWQVPA